MSAAPTAASALRASLARRFDLRTTRVALGVGMVDLVHPANADDLISEADYVRDERLPYWADLWPSARVLAEHIRSRTGGGRRLLELGCGMGLVSTAAVLAGFEVTASDYYEDACAFAQSNAWQNTQTEIDARHLDWSALPDDLGTWDVVVASDVLYEPRYASLVAGALRRTLAPGGRAIIADPGRLALPAFLEACAARELEVEEPECIPWSEGAQAQVIRLFGIRHRAALRMVPGRRRA